MNPAGPRAGILAGGNWLIDHVKVIDAWPPEDGLANIVAQRPGNGGGPYNLLKDLARLGATYPLAGIGLIGHDADGDAILADCAAHRIDTAQLRRTPAAPTSSTDVMTVRATGRRTFFHARGANALLAPEHFDFGDTRARCFHLAYLLLLDALDAPGADGVPRAAEVLRAARAAGLRTSLDCVSASSARFRAQVAPVLPLVDVLFANDYEAEQLTGLTLGRDDALDRAAVEAAARALVALGVTSAAIIHFPAGACACDAAGMVHWQPAVRVPAAQITGTAGAGDAFAAGVLHALHGDAPLCDALELGVCTAAASLREPTCSDGVVPVPACLAWARALGFRTPP